MDKTQRSQKGKLALSVLVAAMFFQMTPVDYARAQGDSPSGTMSVLPAGLACPQNYEPVCGVDGKTYGNACEAGRAGVVVKSSGKCGSTTVPKNCGGIAGLKCPANFDCVMPPGSEKARDMMGTCVPKPNECVVTDLWAPVCGVDGKTYSNEGAAKCAGVAVKSKGECVTVKENCTNGKDDDKDGLVDCKDSDCAKDKACIVCTQEIAPVCGVDGKTYNNSCEAERAGVAVKSKGECVTVKENCTNGKDDDKDGLADCKDPDCAKNAACIETKCTDKLDNDKDGLVDCKDSDCATDKACTPACMCTKEYAPVCGSDGKTYSNACEAKCAGVAVKSKGACVTLKENCTNGRDDDKDGLIDCKDPDCVKDKACTTPPKPNCGGPTGLKCPENFDCIMPLQPECPKGVEPCPQYMPISPDVMGTCVPKPVPPKCGGPTGLKCPENLECVIPQVKCPEGADCMVADDGMGVCLPKLEPQKCGGIAGLPCPENFACVMPPGSENARDMMGTCVPKSGGCVCPELWAPVCGADGKTYSNDCSAKCAGVVVAHLGGCGQACGPNTFDPNGNRDVPCPTGYVCNFPPLDPANMTVGNSGTCVPKPEVCPEIYAPVCGSDGVTYSNDCLRLQAGATLASRGGCLVTKPQPNLPD